MTKHINIEKISHLKSKFHHNPAYDVLEIGTLIIPYGEIFEIIMNYIDKGEELNRRINDRAIQFVQDNYRCPVMRDFAVIENAMHIGALINMELELETDNDA